MLKQKFLNIVGVSIAVGFCSIYGAKNSAAQPQEGVQKKEAEINKPQATKSNIDLNRFLQTAYDFYPELQSARYERSSKESELMNAMSRFAPNVTLSATAGHNPFGASLGDALEKVQDTAYDVNGTVSASLNVFKGGADTFGLASAKARQESYDIEYKGKLQKFLLDGAEVYLNALNAREALEIHKTFELRARYNFERVQTEYKLGASNKTDEYMAKAELAKAQSARIKAQTGFTNAQEAYKEMSGELPHGLTYPALEIKLPNSLEESLVLAEEKALTARAGAAQLRAARHGLAATMAGAALPSVDVFVEYNKPLKEETYDKDNGSGRVGVRVSYELFSNSGRTPNFASVKQSTNQHQAAVYGNEHAQNKMRKEVIAAWHGVNTAKAQKMQGEVAVEASRNAYEGGREQFRLGQLKYADFIKIEEQLLKSELAYLEAKKEAYLAQLRLLAATGTLLPSTLGLVVHNRDDEGR